MANITVRRTGELLRSLFEILTKHPDGMSAAKALEQLASATKMTEFEARLYERSGERRFENIGRWSTVDCVRSGWLTKQRGTWTVTDAGREAYRAFPDPAAFSREASRLYSEWRAGQPDKAQKAADQSSEEVTVAIRRYHI